MAKKDVANELPKAQVSLGEMAERLNEQFAAYLDTPIEKRTPYDWWKRTKSGDISEPMPKPIMVVSRTPVFRWSEIVAWFVRYKGIGKKVAIKPEPGSRVRIPKEVPNE